MFVEYPDASFTQPKPKPAWMGKKHLQHGETWLSVTVAKLIGLGAGSLSASNGKVLG